MGLLENSVGVGSDVFCETWVPQRHSPADVQSRGEELGSQALVVSPSASGQRPRFFPAPSLCRETEPVL